MGKLSRIKPSGCQGMRGKFDPAGVSSATSCLTGLAKQTPSGLVSEGFNPADCQGLLGQQVAHRERSGEGDPSRTEPCSPACQLLSPSGIS